MNEKNLNALEDIMGRLVCCQAVFHAIHMNMAADDIHAAALCGACEASAGILKRWQRWLHDGKASSDLGSVREWP